jgi:hypothetical protein
LARDGEGPVRAVRLNPFYIDVCAVTKQLNSKSLWPPPKLCHRAENLWLELRFSQAHHGRSEKALCAVVPAAPSGGSAWKVPAGNDPKGQGSNVRKRA